MVRILDKTVNSVVARIYMIYQMTKFDKSRIYPKVFGCNKFKTHLIQLMIKFDKIKDLLEFIPLLNLIDSGFTTLMKLE